MRDEKSVPLIGDADRMVVRQFPPPVKRSAIGAWWDARRPARAGWQTADYLQHRLNVYRRKLPQLRHPVPVIAVEDEIRVEEPFPEHPLAPVLETLAEAVEGNRGEVSIEFLKRSGEVVEALDTLRELSKAGEELPKAQAEIGARAERIAGLKEKLEEAISSGAVPVRNGAEDREITLWRFIIGAALLSEMWWLSVAAANLLGIDTGDLARAASSNPLGSVMALALGFGVTALLFIFCRDAADGVVAIAKGDESRRTLAGHVTRVGLEVLTVLAVGIASASVRAHLAEGSRDMAGSSGASGLGEELFPFLLSVFLPAGAALIDRTRLRPLLSRRDLRARHEEVIGRAEAEQRDAEAQVERIRQRIASLEGRLRDAERRLRREIETERRYVMAFTCSVVAALSRDQHAYRLALGRSRGHLASIASYPSARKGGVR